MIVARIAGVRIRGFRRFQREVKFSFPGLDDHPPQTLVIAGQNGQGKSSLFEAILYALGRDEWLHRQLREEDRKQWLTTALTPDARVCVSLDVTEASDTLLAAHTPCTVQITRSHDGWEIRTGPDQKPISDQPLAIHSLLSESALPIEWFSSWRQPYLCGPVTPGAERPPGAYGEAERLWQLKQRLVNERTAGAFRSDPGRNFVFVPGRDIEWLERLNRGWKALRGDDGTELGLGEASSSENRLRYDLYVYKNSEEMGLLPLCPVDQCASGELEWLALAGSLITSDFKGIVLIDEPELHLHRAWQLSLLHALRQVAPESQIVLASHANAPWDQVYTFERILLSSVSSSNE